MERYRSNNDDKLDEYWLSNPVKGLKRGAELLLNETKIKEIPILNKIMEKIPTIKK